MQTFQPLDEKFIVEPSFYIIVHQIENKNLSKSYIRLLDLKKSEVFLLLISRQNTYKQFCEFVHIASCLVFFTIPDSLQNSRQAANSAKTNFISIKVVWSWI